MLQVSYISNAISVHKKIASTQLRILTTHLDSFLPIASGQVDRTSKKLEEFNRIVLIKGLISR